MSCCHKSVIQVACAKCKYAFTSSQILTPAASDFDKFEHKQGILSDPRHFDRYADTTMSHRLAC